MNYELAKQLMDAGFPQIGKTGGNYIYEDGSTFPDYDTLRNTNQLTLVARIPTLEELIEACGEDLHKLANATDRWIASARVANIDNQVGSTPTEAVAKLWLALNTKTV